MRGDENGMMYNTAGIILSLADNMYYTQHKCGAEKYEKYQSNENTVKGNKQILPKN